MLPETSQAEDGCLQNESVPMSSPSHKSIAKCGALDVSLVSASGLRRCGFCLIIFFLVKTALSRMSMVGSEIQRSDGS